MVAKKQSAFSIGPAVYTVLALVILGTFGFWYVQYLSKHGPQKVELTPEAKLYVRNGSLQLSDVAMEANESYLHQMVVEINGKITNAGDRGLETVDLYCVFYDVYGQVVLRERLPIVTVRGGVLKPSQSRKFRLPFDSVPESWNRQVPQLVIAGIKFS